MRVRSLLVALIVLALAAVGAWFAAPRLAGRLPWRAPRVTGTATTTPAAPAGAAAISYVDDSLGWDWQPSCAAPFAVFLARELPGRSISSVTLTLVDARPDLQLPFGTTYRGARVNGNCFNDRGAFSCQVAVVQGEPGPDLDVAATLNAPYTLLDMHLARGADPNAVRRTWSFATFQPLLIPAEEASRWHSACLTLSRAR
jgi:hypothetical protein